MTESSVNRTAAGEGPRKTPYDAPAIVYESGLEVRAGTPLGLPHSLDPLGPQK